MRVTIINQHVGRNPHAEHLREMLRLDHAKSAHIVVAFMTLGGLDRIKSLLRRLAARVSTELIVGVDHRMTTIEALQECLAIPGLAVRVFSVSNPAVVFHPKVYYLEREKDAMCILGSSNLSGGGLWSNCEAGIRMELDLLADSGTAESIRQLINTYSKPCAPFPSECLQTVTKEWLKKYRHMLGTERARHERLIHRAVRRTDTPFPSVGVSGIHKKVAIVRRRAVGRLIIKVTKWDCTYTIVIPRGSEGFFGIKTPPSLPYSDEFKVFATDTGEVEPAHVFAARQSGNFRISTPATHRMKAGDLYVLDVDPRPDHDFRASLVKRGDRLYLGLMKRCVRSAGGKMWGMY